MTRIETDRALERAKRLAANLEGKREALNRRCVELEAGVALAKARGTARPDVDRLLETLQREAHDKKIGHYAGMLTALAQEVMEKPIEIGLDLTMERGLPSLDIFVKRGGRRADIMEHAGGSVTNIVCMGLRAIATNSGSMRQFVALDEPDCWLEPDRIPAFFGVLENMAGTLGMQVLVITHHSLSSLGPDVNVIEISGKPSDPEGLRAVQRPGARQWENADSAGLRFLKLRGFSSFLDVTIPLSPGLNIVMGANDIGKSRLQRALRAVAYGESDDDDIRDGCRSAEVDIGLEGGRILGWSRQPKRNPVTLWRLAGPDGAMADRAGTRCESGGRQVPDWVGAEIGIARVDGLDIQLAHQKLPVFLLEKPGSQRASVLSVAGETGMLRDMIALSKEDRGRDSQTVRNGEQELARLLGQLGRLDVLDTLVCRLDEATAAGSGAVGAEADLARAEAGLARLGAATAGLARARALTAAAAKLPQEPDLRAALEQIRGAEAAGVTLARARSARTRAAAVADAASGLPANPPAPPHTDGAERLAARGASAAAGHSGAAAILAALARLPPDPPGLPETDAAERAAANALAVSRRLAEARGQAATAATEAREAAVEISDLLAGIGNLCPLCGTPGIGHGHILQEAPDAHVH